MSRGSSSEGCLSFISTGVRGRERGNMDRRERGSGAIHRRMGGRFRGRTISLQFYIYR